MGATSLFGDFTGIAPVVTGRE